MSLRARSVVFGYGREPVLDGVDVEVRPGEVLGVVGPNGAGKSTLVRLLSGVVRPDEGSVELDGRPLTKLARREVARSVAVAQQGGDLPDGFRVEEIVAMGRSPHVGLFGGESARDRQVIDWAMERVGVEMMRGESVNRLSGGEKQRVVLARALAQEPRYLLLDEPTTHLDLRHQVELVRHVREQAAAGLGVLVVLHDLNLAARSCDRLVVLDARVVAAGGPPGEVLSGELLRSVYGVEADTLIDSEGTTALVPRF